MYQGSTCAECAVGAIEIAGDHSPAAASVSVPWRGAEATAYVSVWPSRSVADNMSGAATSSAVDVACALAVGGSLRASCSANIPPGVAAKTV